MSLPTTLAELVASRLNSVVTPALPTIWAAPIHLWAAGALGSRRPRREIRGRALINIQTPLSMITTRTGPPSR